MQRKVSALKARQRRASGSGLQAVAAEASKDLILKMSSSGGIGFTRKVTFRPAYSGSAVTSPVSTTIGTAGRIRRTLRANSAPLAPDIRWSVKIASTLADPEFTRNNAMAASADVAIKT